MNRENILAVADAIENQSIPDLGFNMGGFIVETGDDWQDKSGRSCGTVACIAGTAHVLRTGDRTIGHNVRDYDCTPDAEWLGLTEDEADGLFFAVSASANLYEITPSQAVSVLRHLAETGEVDWERALHSTEGERK